MLADPPPDTFRLYPGSLPLCLREEEHELLSAIPREHIPPPDHGLDHVCQLFQDHVPLGMSVTIVDFLEVVHIEQDASEWLPIPLGAFHFLLQLSEEEATVVRLSQIVDQRELLQVQVGML